MAGAVLTPAFYILSSFKLRLCCSTLKSIGYRKITAVTTALFVLDINKYLMMASVLDWPYRNVLPERWPRLPAT
ncbi:hypothetical protein Xmau_04134 [Xenorhabdus mauleonii]|uniref:Uncharacterized protein n=1 Tax=Xenorhabdus mauleonii TaxID=351675 RepID=A0A1I3WB30_9GAMM|nr:hypothetical protein Xmau_04134 [Xenorhabdus mauleonii]SFK04725.1 hypothetical protein SAMN05421680_12538 [Xenorhabdus mauleonii]